MFRKSAIVLAIAAVRESSGLSTAAVARGFGDLDADHFVPGFGTCSAADGGHDGRGGRVQLAWPPARLPSSRRVGPSGMYYGPMTSVPF